MIAVERLDKAGLAWAQDTVTRHHYRRTAVPGRACPEGWAVTTPDLGRVGCLIVGRPQATLCRPWYGSVEEAASAKYGREHFVALGEHSAAVSPRPAAFYAAIAPLGGAATKKKGPDHYAEIGRKGGETLLAVFGTEHYARIGRLGAAAKARRRREQRDGAAG